MSCSSMDTESEDYEIESEQRCGQNLSGCEDKIADESGEVRHEPQIHLSRRFQNNEPLEMTSSDQSQQATAQQVSE